MIRKSGWLILVISMVGLVQMSRAGDDTFTVKGGEGPGKGKKIVLLSGDEEYRSEEAMPQLAKILATHHGFDCTVLFSVDPKTGEINPNQGDSLTDPAALDSADAIVMLLRFRHWPDDVMKHFDDAIKRGVPVIALRTSTHAFNNSSGAFKDYSTFGKKVLGESWVNHWGGHKKEATRGIIEPGAEGLAIMHGVSDVFGGTDVYEAYPPKDAQILLRGQVLKSMEPSAAPADYKKHRSVGDKAEQGINDPMMPVAWTRVHKNENGKENKVLCTTMAAASDLPNEGLRRLIVNGVYWGLGLDVPAKADVAIVGEFKPAFYGFNGFTKGVKPSDIK
jgi:hypothetical protein